MLINSYVRCRRGRDLISGTRVYLVTLQWHPISVHQIASSQPSSIDHHQQRNPVPFGLLAVLGSARYQGGSVNAKLDRVQSVKLNRNTPQSLKEPTRAIFISLKSTSSILDILYQHLINFSSARNATPSAYLYPRLEANGRSIHSSITTRRYSRLFFLSAPKAELIAQLTRL